MQPSQPQEDEAEPEELVRFRQAWLRELEQANARRRPEPDHDQATIPASASQPSYTGEEQLPEPSHHTTAGELTVSSLQPARVFTQGSTVAVDTYRRAVECERQSQLDDALRLYRQAFRMDPNVDKAFHSAEQLQQSAAAPLSGHGPRHKKSDSTDPAAVNNLTRRFGALSVKHTGAGRSVVTGTLASLLDKFPQELIFEPEDEKSGVPISSLPDEILVLILRSLDPTGIERFAAVSRKARVVSLDSGIWREFVEITYKPPQIRHGLALETVAAEYMSDYRRVYIEHPRLRLDGVYIAVCHYIRAGLSENAWVNITHLITYHRYLRFFQNGQVLSLLANEELGPQQVIPLLKPTLRMKGLFIGNWRLDGTTVHITNLADASDKSTLPLPTTYSSSSSNDLLFSSAVAPSSASTSTSNNQPSTATSYSTRYVFQMTLSLRSRPLGRWNKLDFEGYDSVDLESGETTPLSLKHERAFWFSKVRSYTVN